MNCEIELVEKYLKKEFPYVIKVKQLVESKQSISFSGATFTGSSIQPSPFNYELIVCIKESFFYQLENNGPLRNTILNSFTKESLTLIKSVCPEFYITDENLLVSFISETQI